MKTLTNSFNQLVKQLKHDVIFEHEIDCVELEFVVEIYEPTCAMEFVNYLVGINRSGRIVTQQFMYDAESITIHDFKDIIHVEHKRNVLEILKNELSPLI